nr:MAG TPA: hypothetical protein [Caudoviricetes sp.]
MAVCSRILKLLPGNIQDRLQETLFIFLVLPG